MLIKLIKLYLDQEKKFSRKLYNILNLKLHIFYGTSVTAVDPLKQGALVTAVDLLKQVPWLLQ